MCVFSFRWINFLILLPESKSCSVGFEEQLELVISKLM